MKSQVWIAVSATLLASLAQGALAKNVSKESSELSASVSKKAELLTKTSVRTPNKNVNCGIYK